MTTQLLLLVVDQRKNVVDVDVGVDGVRKSSVALTRRNWQTEVAMANIANATIILVIPLMPPLWTRRSAEA